MGLVAIAVMGIAIAFFAWVLCRAADDDYECWNDNDEE